MTSQTLQRWHDMHRIRIEERTDWLFLHYLDQLVNLSSERLDEMIESGEVLAKFFETYLLPDCYVARLAMAVRDHIELPAQTERERELLQAYAQYQNLKADLSILRAEQTQRAESGHESR